MTLNYIVAFFFLALGLYCMVTKHNLFKVVIGMSIVDYGVNLLIVSVGATNGGTAPIFTAGEITESCMSSITPWTPGRSGG